MLTFQLIFILSVIVVIATLAEEILLVILFRPFRPSSSSAELPFVSILLAMRDEESNAKRCLDALLRLNYPIDKLEILCGNDGSSDRTYEILNLYASRYSHIKVFNIDSTLGIARGKANVLAHLTKVAKGDVFLITDADVAVNPSWCMTMVSGLKKGVGLVNGFTSVAGGYFQHLEWVQAQGMLHVLQQFTVVTSIGNNMMVTREAYEATGGFENIPLPVTEDFALTREVKKLGYRLESRLCRDTHGETIAMSNSIDLLKQRKRWMQGAMRAPFRIFMLLFVRALYFPSIALITFYSFQYGLAIFTTKLLWQAILIVRVNQESGKRIHVLKLFLYEFYAMAMIWAEIGAFLWPGKVRWKERDFI